MRAHNSRGVIPLHAPNLGCTTDVAPVSRGKNYTSTGYNPALSVYTYSQEKFETADSTSRQFADFASRPGLSAWASAIGK